MTPAKVARSCRGEHMIGIRGNQGGEPGPVDRLGEVVVAAKPEAFVAVLGHAVGR